MRTKQINLSKFSSIKIGEVVDVNILESCEDYKKEFRLIGACNNILIGNNPPPLMILSKKFDYIKVEENTLIVGGATPSGKIASFCKKHNIKNFEFLFHLPGTLGGLVFMNAGLKEYEIFNHLLELKTCDGVKQKNEVEFGYRFTNITSPILEATFSLECGFDKERVAIFKKMRENQPSTSSAGSCFKNPKGNYAGRLIEAVGLKGKRVGDMEFSSQHANFLVNHGDGNFNDALYLIKEAQKRVKEGFEIELKCEILILDKKHMG